MTKTWALRFSYRKNEKYLTTINLERNKENNYFYIKEIFKTCHDWNYEKIYYEWLESKNGKMNKINTTEEDNRRLEYKNLNTS